MHRYSNVNLTLEHRDYEKRTSLVEERLSNHPISGLDCTRSLMIADMRRRFTDAMGFSKVEPMSCVKRERERERERDYTVSPETFNAAFNRGRIC